MYWIGDKDKALGLTRKARDMETKIKSEMIVSYEEAKNIYLDEENKIKPIFENVSITDLMKDQYNNSIIIQNEDNYKNDLFNLLQEIMKQHNYIPTKIKHKKYTITRLTLRLVSSTVQRRGMRRPPNSNKTTKTQ